MECAFVLLLGDIISKVSEGKMEEILDSFFVQYY